MVYSPSIDFWAARVLAIYALMTVTYHIIAIYRNFASPNDVRPLYSLLGGTSSRRQRIVDIANPAKKLVSACLRTFYLTTAPTAVKWVSHTVIP